MMEEKTSAEREQESELDQEILKEIQGGGGKSICTQHQLVKINNHMSQCQICGMIVYH